MFPTQSAPHQQRRQARYFGRAAVQTILEKASFKLLVSSQRCVILADDYHEWKTLAPKDRQPFWIHRPSGYPFGMAGLWARNTKVSPDGELKSSTIITVPSNEDTRAVHDRMPAILFDQNDINGWLKNSEVDRESRMNNIIRTANSGTLELRPVAKIVNSARVERPELIQTIA
jgi:putative SOS response-associated peptidase YedK